AGLAAERLRSSGFEVTERIGGTGVVGLLQNGAGATVMLRADMDALPIAEQTGLPYASTVTATDANGNDTPVMHACGHDMHVAWLAAAATLFGRATEHWQGTLIALFQPGEETAQGARAMIDDGLFERFPKPDVILGQHVMPSPAGLIGSRRDHVGCRQPADSPVRPRRARLDAAGQRRPGRHGRRDRPAAADDRR